MFQRKTSITYIGYYFKKLAYVVNSPFLCHSLNCCNILYDYPVRIVV